MANYGYYAGPVLAKLYIFSTIKLFWFLSLLNEPGFRVRGSPLGAVRVYQEWKRIELAVIRVHLLLGPLAIGAACNCDRL